MIDGYDVYGRQIDHATINFWNFGSKAIVETE